MCVRAAVCSLTVRATKMKMPANYVLTTKIIMMRKQRDREEDRDLGCGKTNKKRGHVENVSHQTSYKTWGIKHSSGV